MDLFYYISWNDLWGSLKLGDSPFEQSETLFRHEILKGLDDNKASIGNEKPIIIMNHFYLFLKCFSSIRGIY